MICLGYLSFDFQCDYLLPSKHLLVLIQQYNQKEKVWKIFKVKNIGTRNNNIYIVLVSLLLTFNTPFSRVYIADFGHVLFSG